MHIKVLGRGKPTEEKKRKGKEKKTAMEKEVLVRFCPVFIYFSFAKLSLCSASSV